MSLKLIAMTDVVISAPAGRNSEKRLLRTRGMLRSYLSFLAAFPFRAWSMTSSE
jgi:hypothetical protein